MAKMDEIQSDVPDLESSAREVSSALSCASSCETLEDLLANLEEAEEAAKALIKEIRTLRNKATQGD